MGVKRDFDYDWLVIGSGFGGSVSALRLAEKGYSVGVLECGTALRGPRVPALHGGPEALLLEPAAGHEGHLPADHLQGRLGRLRLRRGRRQPRLREHAVRAAEAVLRGPPVGGDGGLGGELAPHYAEAQRMLGVDRYPHDDPADQLLRELGEELGVGDTYKKTPVASSSASRARPVRGPVLRRRGPRPHGLHAVRALHGGLPARREEHARQELPVLRREARRARDARTHRHRHPPARRGRRQRRLRGRKRALGRLAAQGTPRAARARRGRRRPGRWARTGCCSAAG